MRRVSVHARGDGTRDNLRRTSNEVRRAAKASHVHFGEEMTPTTFSV
jgi:hypothetical protein